MKTFIERMTMYILVMVLLVPSIGIKTDKAAAAGEIIEFNEYTVPARSLTGSRGPIKYEGEDNWYPSKMYVDMPANTFNVKWDKVRNFFYITMSNSYMPTRWEMYREGLGGNPRTSTQTDLTMGTLLIGVSQWRLFIRMAHRLKSMEWRQGRGVYVSESGFVRIS